MFNSYIPLLDWFLYHYVVYFFVLFCVSYVSPSIVVES